MDFRKIVPLFLLGVALPTLAEIRTEIDARELKPSNMTVPTSVNSRLSFRACNSCDIETARLTPATTFSFNGEVMEFADFRDAMLVLRQRNKGYALVSIDTKSNTVHSLQVAD